MVVLTGYFLRTWRGGGGVFEWVIALNPKGKFPSQTEGVITRMAEAHLIGKLHAASRVARTSHAPCSSARLRDLLLQLLAHRRYLRPQRVRAHGVAVGAQRRALLRPVG